MDAMSFQDYALARQHLTETRIGTRLREHRALEDAQVKRSKSALQRSK